MDEHRAAREALQRAQVTLSVKREEAGRLKAAVPDDFWQAPSSAAELQAQIDEVRRGHVGRHTGGVLLTRRLLSGPGSNVEREGLPVMSSYMVPQVGAACRVWTRCEWVVQSSEVRRRLPCVNET
jgi:hypothetical protein